MTGTLAPRLTWSKVRRMRTVLLTVAPKMRPTAETTPLTGWTVFGGVFDKNNYLTVRVHSIHSFNILYLLVQKLRHFTCSPVKLVNKIEEAR